MSDEDVDIGKIPPVDLVENLKWRKEIVPLGWASRRDADQLWEMCRKSLRFFVFGFGWTYSPKDKLFGKIAKRPMERWEFQEEALDAVEEAIEAPHDLVVEKSREMGASWIALWTFVHRWMFHEDQSILVASRTEKYVDAPGNPKSLFWKIEFILRTLPNYLLPGRGKGFDKTFASLVNLENGNTINGESSTENLARGDRRTCLFVDEFAAYDVQAGWAVMGSTRDVSGCRIFNSTPGLVPGAFESIANNPDFRKITLHWSRHPRKNVGMYAAANGKVRSPWYDAECKRCATPQEIARELDIDYSAAAGAFFPQELLNRTSQSVRNPISVGTLAHMNGVPTSWTEGRDGRIHLWRVPDAANRFPEDRDYVLSCDVSTGTGASNSVAQVFDRLTGEQVLEMADPTIHPDKFAALAVAIGRWFAGKSKEGAIMVFENMGPGLVFAQLCWSMGYRRFYMRRKEQDRTRPETELIGLYSNKDEKVRQFNLLRKMLVDGTIIPRSSLAVSECREIVYSSSGNVEHKGAQGLDPSGAKLNHGDRASCLSFAATALFDAGYSITSRLIDDLRRPGPFLQRRIEHERMRRLAEAESD